jgi:hypothetical protein
MLVYNAICVQRLQEIDEVVSTLMGAMLARLEADAWCLSLVQELVEVAIDCSINDSPPSQLLQQRLSTHALNIGGNTTSSTSTTADAAAELRCDAMYSTVLHALGYTWCASAAAAAAAAAVFDLSSSAGCISSDSDSDSDFGASLLHQSDSASTTVDTAIDTAVATAVGAWGTEHWSLIAAEVFVARARAQRGPAARHCRVATLAAMAAAEPQLLQLLTVRSSTVASGSSTSSGSSSGCSSSGSSATAGTAVAGIGARQQRARQRSGSIEVRYIYVFNCVRSACIHMCLELLCAAVYMTASLQREYFR